MTWIEKEAFGETLREAIPIVAMDDEFAMLLARIDAGEAERASDRK